MRLNRPQLVIALFSAVVVVSVAVVDLGRTSPGPLTAVHEREPDLAGRRDCSECHGGWRRTMSQACLDCHERIGEQIEAGTGLHGVQGETKANQCALCHSEHHGPGFAIVNRQSFARAGVSDPEAFDHELIGFVMEGKHLELDCIRCHENAVEAVLPQGAQRYGGLERDCGACHEDAHEGRMLLSCVSCHGQTDFHALQAAGHDEHLPLIGGHAEVACSECHAKDGPSSLDVLGASRRPNTPRTCAECHESPHARAFVDGVARLESLAPDAACVSCHVAEHESFRAEGLEVSAAQHACSGFELAPPHDEAACEDCHTPDVDDFAWRYPGREAQRCAGCHEDPHGGQFDELAFAAEGCIACHAREHFEPHEFTAEEHAWTALELTGRHAEIECNACHVDPEPETPRRFHGMSAQCSSCHEDAHDGFFDGRADPERPDEAPAQAPSCARCHRTTAFADLPETGFDHLAWTGFDVLGAHAQGDCESCHERAAEPDAAGRSFGRVHELHGPFEGCLTCHEDPHQGRFDGPGTPAQVDGRSDCARCHVETSFRAFPDGFDHRLWTGFALRGAHAEVGCSGCHAPLARPDASGRTWAPARGGACEDCHADPHAGQFRRDGRADCARCHASTTSFTRLVFDHESDARFPLGEAHSGLECQACHDRWAVSDELEIVRYKPLPVECVDCHGVHEEPLLKRKGRGK